MQRVLPSVQRENHLEIPYQAPLVRHLEALGVGFEVLLSRGEEYLVGHYESGLPFILGKLDASHPVEFSQRSGKFLYQYLRVGWVQI